MEEAAAADGAEFALRKETGERGFGDGFEDASDVVIGHVEQADAAPVAGEEQAACGSHFVPHCLFHELAEVFVGGLSIAHVVLDRLSGADETASNSKREFGFLLDKSDHYSRLGADSALASLNCLCYNGFKKREGARCYAADIPP